VSKNSQRHLKMINSIMIMISIITYYLSRSLSEMEMLKYNKYIPSSSPIPIPP